MQEYISKENKIALEEEYRYLSTEKRKEIIAAVEYAKSLGDWSENAEYHEARNDQRKLEERLSQIETTLKNAVVVERKSSDIVEMGATVKVKKIGDGTEREFLIVGAEEADMAAGKISYKSPLGSALMGAKKGDTVSFESPNGTTQYSILSIS